MKIPAHAVAQPQLVENATHQKYSMKSIVNALAKTQA
jgi:hypothetical protein